MALYTPTWKILASMFMPFFLFTVKFHDEPVGRSDDENTDEVILRSQKDYDRASVAIMGSNNQIVPVKKDKGVGDGIKEEFVLSKRPKKKNASDRLRKVGCFGECTNNPDTISFLHAMFYYYKSPVTKFYFHTLSYVIYLALFSYLVLIDLQSRGDGSEWMSPIEFIVWGWNISLVMEEYRQVLTKDPKSVMFKMSSYFSSIWNRFDQFVHFLFFLSILLRLTLTGDDFVWARMFYCVTLFLYYLRFLQSFFVAKNLGPKVIMIKRMVTDLMFFLAILIVFILGYGVTSQALLYPNARADWMLLKNVIYQPYWNIYGELFLEDIEGEVPGCSSNWTEIDMGSPRCPEKNALAVILFAIYMILTNVLLLNLLIAMFSYTFERVQENSEKVWRYYRYSLIYEYFDRPTLAPPLIVINHFVRIIKSCRRKCQNNPKISHDFKTVLLPEADNKLTAFERVGMENYLHNKHILEREHINVKVSSAGERIEKVIEDLETIKEQIGPDGGLTTEVISVTKQPDRSPEKEDIVDVHRRINKLESHLENQQQQLSNIQDLLQNIASASAIPGSNNNTSPIQTLAYVGGSTPHIYQHQQSQHSTGTFILQAPPIAPLGQVGTPANIQYASPPAHVAPVYMSTEVTGGGGLGGVPLSPTRRPGFRSYTSPQIEIEDIQGERNDRGESHS